MRTSNETISKIESSFANTLVLSGNELRRWHGGLVKALSLKMALSLKNLNFET